MVMIYCSVIYTIILILIVLRGAPGKAA